MAKHFSKILQKYKSVDGRIFQEGDATFHLHYSQPEGIGESTFQRGFTYSEGALFYSRENARLFLKGRSSIEAFINRDYETCTCNCGSNSEYGCSGHWENKKYVDLYYNPTHEYDTKTITETLINEAKENAKAMAIYEKYKKNYDPSKWELYNKTINC